MVLAGRHDVTPPPGGRPINGMQHNKSGKASFGHIYNQPDPRQYFETLDALDYAIPAHAQAVFSAMVASRLARAGGTGLRVLDVCCSYGINAALLNHDVTLDELYQRYSSSALAGLTSEDLASADAEFYRERRLPSAVPVVGLDVAANAVAYGERTGILTAGMSVNLEHAEPDADLTRHLKTVGLVTVTGGVGYISGRTFARILDHCPTADPPAVAAFALRWVDYEPIADTLLGYGLVTEKLAGVTFPQRRFADDEERTYVLDQLAAMDIDPTGKEAKGAYHAELYISRPAAEMASLPINELLQGVV
jgi:hypothetical protein